MVSKCENLAKEFSDVEHSVIDDNPERIFALVIRHFRHREFLGFWRGGHLETNINIANNFMQYDVYTYMARECYCIDQIQLLIKRSEQI